MSLANHSASRLPILAHREAPLFGTRAVNARRLPNRALIRRLRAMPRAEVAVSLEIVGTAAMPGKASVPLARSVLTQ